MRQYNTSERSYLHERRKNLTGTCRRAGTPAAGEEGSDRKHGCAEHGQPGRRRDRAECHGRSDDPALRCWGDCAPSNRAVPENPGNVLRPDAEGIPAAADAQCQRLVCEDAAGETDAPHAGRHGTGATV